MEHELMKVPGARGNQRYLCLVWKDGVVIDAKRHGDPHELIEWRAAKYWKSTRIYNQCVNALVDVWVGENVYRNVLVLREVTDVRKEAGVPDGERPEWEGAGFIGLCPREEGGGQLVFAWGDIDHQPGSNRPLPRS